MSPRKRTATASTSSRAQGDWLRRSGGIAVGVIGVGGETEADGAFVCLFRRGVELRQAGEVSGDQGKDAGGHGIECAEVADGAFVEDAAGAVDDVVRGESGGLVDDEDAIHEKIGVILELRNCVQVVWFFILSNSSIAKFSDSFNLPKPLCFRSETTNHDTARRT